MNFFVLLVFVTKANIFISNYLISKSNAHRYSSCSSSSSSSSSSNCCCCCCCCCWCYYSTIFHSRNTVTVNDWLGGIMLQWYVYGIVTYACKTTFGHSEEKDTFITTRQCGVVMHSAASVCVSACLVRALTFECLDLQTSFFGFQVYVFRTSMLRSWGKGQGQGHTTVTTLCLRKNVTFLLLR